jgi:hypothetical protein
MPGPAALGTQQQLRSPLRRPRRVRAASPADIDITAAMMQPRRAVEEVTMHRIQILLDEAQHAFLVERSRKERVSLWG